MQLLMSPPQLLLLLTAHSVVRVCGSGSSSDGIICAASDSLTKLADFFDRHADRFDADAFLGLTMASSVLKAAPSAVAARVADSCGESQMIELRRAQSQIDRMLDHFRSRMKLPTASFYDRRAYNRICLPFENIFKRLIDPDTFRWMRRLEGTDSDSDRGSSGSTPGHYPAFLLINHNKLLQYNESAGDACLRSVLHFRKGQRCHISPFCQHYFLESSPVMGYQLTHHLMFWMAAMDRSCQLRLSNGRLVDRSLTDDACREAYKEFRHIFRALPTSFNLFDTAIEEANLCGILGHRDFFTDWAAMAMRRLQDERLGCYLDQLDDYGARGNSSSSASSTTQQASTGRKMMHDVKLDGVCSAHTSALAMGYFTLLLLALA